MPFCPVNGSFFVFYAANIALCLTEIAGVGYFARSRFSR
jgi:hypothetical protein